MVVAVLLLIVLVAFSHQDETSNSKMKEKINAAYEECAKENYIDVKVLQEAFKENKLQNEDNFKCFYKCLYKKTNVMSDADKVNLNAVKDNLLYLFVDKEKAKTAIDKCTDLPKGSNGCQVAFDVTKCIHDNYDGSFNIIR